MSDTTETRAALITAANSFLIENESIQTQTELFEGLPVISPNAISWENKNFDPATKPFWVSVFYVPASTVGRTIGQGGMNQTVGFLQIDFNSSPDTGEAVQLAWEKKASIFFHLGRFFSFNSHSVIVTGSQMSQGRHIENFFRKSYTVNFKSHSKRQHI